MTSYKFATRGVAAVLFSLLASATALAAGQSGNGYHCLLTRRASDTHRVVTICDARTPEALARLSAAGCDPATMSDAAMRALCATLTGETPAHFGNHPGGAGSR
jgi:hypothetical protein